MLAAKVMFEPTSAGAGAPMKQTTTGLEARPAAASTFAATVSAGGLDSRRITDVSGSLSSIASASSIMMPPTASDRSRPPTPTSWEMPEPSASTRTETSWLPVPLAATTPTGPRFTAFAKQSAVPLMIAVPQSGPMTSSPASWARVLMSTSSSTETLSEKISTLRPAAMARRASSAA